MQRVLITGAGRGIGLELARLYARRGDRVLAGCRNLERAPALREIAEQSGGRLSIVPLEVGNLDSISAAVRRVQQQVEGLDVLINNAATNPGDAHLAGPDGQPLLDAGRSLEVYRINALAPLLVAQSFLTPLRAGTNPRVVNITSRSGSLTLKTRGEDYAYSASKAALNMVTRAFAFSAQAKGITVVALSPGWVRTDMGGPTADLAPEDSARSLLAVIDRLTPADSGGFFHYDGSVVPW